MTDRMRNIPGYGGHAKGPQEAAAGNHDLGPKKTLLVVVIVVGCFAVLWPKVFYPMLVGSAQQHIKPSPIDRTTGCCNVISESDVNTIKIMSELCKTIINKENETSSRPPTGRQIISICQKAVLETCGIDISAVLQEQVRLGQSTKQIIDEIRSLNGSLCLKYNFGVSPGTLGVSHRVTVKVSPSYTIRQERPPHLRSEMVHPAFRERGRAIPQTQGSSPSRPPSRIVEGRPGPIPGMRPTLGGAGHMVSPKQSAGTMGLIMPVYTVGIVIFFTYTVMKIVFKKQPESLYPPVEPDPMFRREVFESNRGHKATRETYSNKLVVNAMSALLDEVDQELATRRRAGTGTEQDIMANGKVHNHEDQASVKVLGMEMTASCEGGKKWTRPGSPVTPAPPPPVHQPTEPPQEIYLEGSLPPQSNHLLVSDSATEAQKTSTDEDPAVVLAGKMTLSVISLDSSENDIEESIDPDKKKESGQSSGNTSEDFEKIDVNQIEQEEAESEIKQAEEILTAEDNVAKIDATILSSQEEEISEVDSTLVKAETDEEQDLAKAISSQVDPNTLTSEENIESTEELVKVTNDLVTDLTDVNEENVENLGEIQVDDTTLIETQITQDQSLFEQLDHQEGPAADNAIKDITEDKGNITSITPEQIVLENPVAEHESYAIGAMDSSEDKPVLAKEESAAQEEVFAEENVSISEKVAPEQDKSLEEKPAVPTTEETASRLEETAPVDQTISLEQKSSEVTLITDQKGEVQDAPSEEPAKQQPADSSAEEKFIDLFKRTEEAMDESYRTEGSENTSETDRFLDEILSEEAKEQRKEKIEETAEVRGEGVATVEAAREPSVEIEDSDEEIEYEIEEDDLEDIDGSANAVVEENRVNGIQSNGENSEDEEDDDEVEEIHEVVEYITDEEDVEEEEEIEEDEVERLNNATHS